MYIIYNTMYISCRAAGEHAYDSDHVVHAGLPLYPALGSGPLDTPAAAAAADIKKVLQRAGGG